MSSPNRLSRLASRRFAHIGGNFSGGGWSPLRTSLHTKFPANRENYKEIRKFGRRARYPQSPMLVNLCAFFHFSRRQASHQNRELSAPHQGGFLPNAAGAGELGLTISQSRGRRVRDWEKGFKAYERTIRILLINNSRGLGINTEMCTRVHNDLADDAVKEPGHPYVSPYNDEHDHRGPRMKISGGRKVSGAISWGDYPSQRISRRSSRDRHHVRSRPVGRHCRLGILRQHVKVDSHCCVSRNQETS